MKRIPIVLLGILSFAITSYGGSISKTLSVSVTNTPCDKWGDPCGGPHVSFVAQFTMTPETKQFFDFTNDISFYGTEPVVTSITGRLNGKYAMTLVPPPVEPEGSFGWLLDNNLPQGIYFSADGFTWDLVNNALGDTELSGPQGISVVNFSATPTPEPSTWMLFLMGILLVLILRFRKLGLKGLSQQSCCL
jgi:hypothetical protein